VATSTRYRLSGWLGGTATSRAAVTVAFLSATGAVLARHAISHGRGNDRLAYRAAAGTLPPGTTGARVTLVLATSLTNDDGPNAPLVGYDRAVADGLRFSVSAPVRRPPPLTPPAAHVPRYQHVFLFYFENEDPGAVIGNTKQAPFLNSLVPHASVLASTKVFVVGGDSDTVTPIAAATGRAGRGIPVGYSPAAVAISPSGGTAYVVNTISGTLTPVSTATGVAGRPVRTGIYTYPTAIGLTPSGATAVVIGTYAGRATLVSTRTGKVTARITVGLYPVAVAIVG
jgi:hypothetical protein